MRRRVRPVAPRPRARRRVRWRRRRGRGGGRRSGGGEAATAATAVAATARPPGRRTRSSGDGEARRRKVGGAQRALERAEHEAHPVRLVRAGGRDDLAVAVSKDEAHTAANTPVLTTLGAEGDPEGRWRAAVHLRVQCERHAVARRGAHVGSARRLARQRRWRQRGAHERADGGLAVVAVAEHDGGLVVAVASAPRGGSVVAHLDDEGVALEFPRPSHSTSAVLSRGCHGCDAPPPLSVCTCILGSHRRSTKPRSCRTRSAAVATAAAAAAVSAAVTAAAARRRCGRWRRRWR